MIEYTEVITDPLKRDGHLLFMGVLPKTTYDFKEYRNKVLLMRCGAHIAHGLCVGVEHFAHAAPYRVGERVGFLLKVSEMTAEQLRDVVQCPTTKR